MQTVILKHGEKKTLKFAYTENGLALPITSAELTLTIKEKILDVTPAMTIDDADFTKTKNVARCDLDTTSLKQGTTYVAEIKAVFGSTSLDKSDTFDLRINQSVDGE